jgi:hypothetical protein
MAATKPHTPPSPAADPLEAAKRGADPIIVAPKAPPPSVEPGEGGTTLPSPPPTLDASTPDARAPIEPTAPPAECTIVEWRVKETRTVSLRGQIHTVRAGRILSREYMDAHAAALREQGVTLEEVRRTA